MFKLYFFLNGIFFLFSGSDGHKSTYNAKWVIDMWTRNTKIIKPFTCFGAELEKLPPKLSYDDVTQEKGLKELLTSILKYGVGIVTNVSKLLYCAKTSKTFTLFNILSRHEWKSSEVLVETTLDIFINIESY